MNRTLTIANNEICPTTFLPNSLPHKQNPVHRPALLQHVHLALRAHALGSTPRVRISTAAGC